MPLAADHVKALALAEGQDASARAIERVARETSPETARWAFEQWDLRRRAERKFALAREMLFTREALEQANHEAIAAYHASRFPEGAKVADLTCGIGADLIALARRGPAVGFEIDPERAAYARHNLAVSGLHAEVKEENALDHLDDFDYALADPGRRREGRRVSSLDDYQPDPLEIAERCREKRLVGIEGSPMLTDEDLLRLGGCVEFVSFGNECREALLWIGRKAENGVWAVRAGDGQRLARSPMPNLSQSALAFLYEADPAAIRAHALGALAQTHRLLALGDSNGYLTGEEAVASPWLTGYRVLGEFPLRESALRSAVRDLQGTVEIVKSRAKGVDVDRWRKLLTGPGERCLILAAYPIGARIRAVLLAPLTAP